MDPVTSGGPGLGYPDSVDSSPRSRGGESWDEPFPSSAAAAASKLRLMCSYGGRIVPRPTDKSLCYLGGETRIVVVDRHSSLGDLSAKLSRNLLNGRAFSLKYQLPNEDLDSLISVTTDEDLENMIEEYDRIVSSSSAAGNSTGGGGGSTRSSRVRLFLFPTKPDSAPSSIGSLLDDSKSENWFVDALNGSMGIDGLPRGLSSDSASVNCLLGLEDDSSVHSRVGGGGGGGGSQTEADQVALRRPESSGKLARQDVHSVPDSPMLDTTSSFGSASSAPSLSNLPPIRVRPDDRPPDQRYGGIDEHFAQMNLNSAAAAASSAVQRPEEGYKPPSIPLPTASGSTPTISPTENPNRPGVFSFDDDKPDRKQQPAPAAPPQQKPGPIEVPISDSMGRTVYYQQERIPPAGGADPKRDQLPPVSDPSSYRMQPVPEPGYVLPTMPPPPPQPDQIQNHPQLHPHQQQQQQQQYIHQPNPHFIPMQSYYQVQHPIPQTQPFDHQIPMYYLPVRQNPAAAPPAPVPISKLPAAKPDMAPNLYRTGPPQAQLIHVAAPDQTHMGNYGYHVMHHHHPSQPTQMANYGYEYASAPDPQQHAQVYYTQTTSPPSMPPGTQYQPVMSEAQPGEMKQNRGS